MTLKLFVLIQGSFLSSYIVLGSMVRELHDMRIVCLLRAVTLAWVINTIPFTILFDYFHHSVSFEILQA